jgi:predicted transcriptional regulator
MSRHEKSLAMVAWLLENGPATPRDLAREAHMPLRTVQWALRRLRDTGVSMVLDPDTGRYSITGGRDERDGQQDQHE